jgi:microcystin-dependent protein
MANVAMLMTVADSTASQTAGAASPLMPSGVILPYAGSTSPSGWLACDGTAYNQADYPTLFAALGSTYNTQVNPTTGAAWAAPSAGQFRVPDMRGLFLRGEGTASGGDAVSVGGHQVQKTAKNGLGNASSSLSGNTGAINNNHTHTAMRAGIANGGWIGSGSAGAGQVGFVDTAQTSSDIQSHTHATTGTAAAQTISGDNETRPANRGVRYIIKV